MNTMISRFLLIFLCGAYVSSFDDVELEIESNVMTKLLREMTETTKADSLNLPANATSIRENITDTFSCENRTYGYYADVDNECQVFHVCLPSQTPSGRNLTFRFSFICPDETVFNQEVLVCTRPRDAIDCEDSPLYYDLNLEIGKVPNKTNEHDDSHKQHETTPSPKVTKPKETENVKVTNQRRKDDKRKQNIIIEHLMKDVVNDELREKLQEFALQHTDIIPEDLPEIEPEVIPIVIEPENVPNIEDYKEEIAMTDEEIEGRIALERNMRSERKLGRGTFRFKADI